MQTYGCPLLYRAFLATYFILVTLESMNWEELFLTFAHAAAHGGVQKLEIALGQL